MVKKDQTLDTFFNNYSDVFNKSIQTNKPDLEKTASFFANSFISANPAGINCGRNDEAFLDAMQKGYAYYKNIGITSMEIVSKKISSLDDIHSMTRVRWKSNFQRKDKSTGSIEFENIYFTQDKENQHKIFGWITSDEVAALKEIGLI